MTESAHAGETLYVVYAPYLPLSFRENIGAWELIPHASLEDGDAIDAEVARLARGVADLFELPRGPHANVGTFARPDDGRVGDDPQDMALINDLRRALVAGVLDQNASPLLSEDERSPNAGHEAYTSDNAIVVANGIRDGWTGTITGGRVRHLELGIQVLPDDELPRLRIAPPGDLRIPLMGPRPDVFYADAAWESMRRGTDDARRLGRAIDWLDAGWRNASGLTDDLRIPALFAGFEVLFDSDDKTVVRRRLSTLLDAFDAPTQVRTWTSRAGNPQSEAMTDLAWWFLKFADLRNAIMHGRELTHGDWLHEDNRPHIDLGDWWLRQAIKETVARDGHGDVREDPIWRDALIRTRKMTQALENAEADQEQP
jgi:hypothetical protein